MTSSRKVSMTAGIAFAAAAFFGVLALTAKENEPAPSADLTATGAVLKQAAEFRTAASADFNKSLTQFAADKVLGFLSRAALTEAQPEAWSAFMTSSLVLMGHVESPEPVVAFYNPLYDAVLITRWAPKGDAAAMVAADLRVASGMASEDAVPPEFAVWLKTMAKKPAPEAIKDEYNRFLKAFEKAYPPKAKSIAKVALSVHAEKTAAFVEGQAIDSLHNVVAVQQVKSPKYIARLKELRNALARRDQEAMARLVPKTSATSAGVLLEMPEGISQNLVPCYALVGDKGSMVFLQDTLLPRYYLLVVFRHGATAHDTEVRTVFFFELPQDGR